MTHGCTSQELYERSERVLGCITAPKYRVIHRSVLFGAVQKQLRSYLKTILEAIDKTDTEVGEKGKILDQLNAEGNTLMHISARQNDIETIKLLLDNGADPTIEDADEKGPLNILENTSEIAHLLVQMASEGKLEKEDVSTILCSKDRDNRLILATLDEEPQRIAAAFNKTKTCLSLAFMGNEFLNWIYTEAEEGRWPSQIVFKELVKENVGGVDVITSGIKPGNMFIDQPIANSYH